jgi:hypothetical protein
VSRRYVSNPSKADIVLVRKWFTENKASFNLGQDDPFDIAVDCAYDLEIFDFDQHEIDPSEEFCIPAWIVDAAEKALDP